MSSVPHAPVAVGADVAAGQPPPSGPLNLFTTGRALQEAVEREGGSWPSP